MGGVKPNTILRAGSDHTGSWAARALSAMAYMEIATERTASHIQMKTQRVGLAVAAASDAAARAVAPTNIVPHPETAVKVAAASIVSRMKRRLSIARACILGVSDGRKGRTLAMAGE